MVLRIYKFLCINQDFWRNLYTALQLFYFKFATQCWLWLDVNWSSVRRRPKIRFIPKLGNKSLLNSRQAELEPCPKSFAELPSINDTPTQKWHIVQGLRRRQPETSMKRDDTNQQILIPQTSTLLPSTLALLPKYSLTTSSINWWSVSLQISSPIRMTSWLLM